MRQLSNRQFISNIDKILTTSGEQVCVITNEAVECDCGCGQKVARGRKFMNQQHYDRSKGLTVPQLQELLVRFQQGISKHQLAHDYGVALSTVKRALKKQIG